MAAIIHRLCCAQLPEVVILGISSGHRTQYLAHASQLIGLSVNKTVRRTAGGIMHAFLKSEEGKSIKHGGDLVTAFCRVH